MAQVFGNRILGGIGAPGGQMAEAFGAGVNTSITNRANRQAMDVNAQNMAINAQELAWKEEDRKIAAQQRAAAAAAASAAKAQQKAYVDAYMRTFGGAGGASPVVGVKLPTGPAVARDRQGPTTTAAPAAPSTARPAGVTVTPRGPLGFSPTGGGAITGGASTPALAGGTGVDRLGAVAAPRDRQPVDVVRPPLVGVVGRATPSGAVSTTVSTAQMNARPGNFAAQATQQALRTSQLQGVLPATDVADVVSGAEAGALGSANLPRMLAYKQELQARRVAEVQARQSGEWRWPWQGEDLDALIAEEKRVDEAIAKAGMTPATGIQPRGVTALEGPEAGFGRGTTSPTAPSKPAPSVTIQGPNGPVTVPAAAETDGGLSMGTVVAPTTDAAATDYLGTPTESLSFGPKLGAMPETAEDVLVNEFVSRTGFDLNAKAPPAMGQPGAPNKAINQLLTQRDQQVQWAQALVEMGRYDEAIQAQTVIAGIDSKLEVAVARQAVQELELYNAPQRLNAIWSDRENRDIQFVPKGDGNVDVYADGALLNTIPMAQLAEQTRTMTDAAYAEKQAAYYDAERMAQATAAGEAAGGAPYKQAQTAFEADVEVTKQQLLAGIEIDKDTGIKNNETTQKVIEYALELSNKLPSKDKTFTYRDTANGGIAVYDGADLIALYMPSQVQNADGTVTETVVEVRQ